MKCHRQAKMVPLLHEGPMTLWFWLSFLVPITIFLLSLGKPNLDISKAVQVESDV